MKGRSEWKKSRSAKKGYKVTYKQSNPQEQEVDKVQHWK